MRVKRIAKWVGLGVGGLLLVLVVGAFIVLNLIDLNAFKPRIAAAVEQATGRKLTIAGDLSLSFTLAPSLVVEDVALANAPWAETPQLAHIDRIEARLYLLPLLAGRLSLDEIVVSGPDLMLAKNAEGVGNWEFRPGAPEPEPETGPPQPPPAVTFNAIRLERGGITYSDAASGRVDRVRIGHLIASMEGADSPINLYGYTTLNGVALALNGRVGNLGRLSGRSPYPVNLQLTGAGATVGVEGTIAEPLAARGLDLSVTVAGESVAELGSLVRAAAQKPTPVPDLGPYELALRLQGGGDLLSLAELKGAIGREAAVKAVLDGSVLNLTKAEGVDLGLELIATDLSPLEVVAAAALPTVPPSRIKLRASAAEGVYTLEDIDLRMGESRVTGMLSADTTQSPLYVVAELESSRLDLAEMIPKPAAGVAAAAEPDGAQAVPASAPVAMTGPPHVIPDLKLPLALLNRVNADIAFEAGSIQAKEMLIGDAVIRAVARNGILVLTRAEGHIAGGEAAASFILDARNPDNASVHTGVTVTGIEVGSVLKETGTGDTLSGAPIDVSVALAATGGTVRDLAAHLNGDVLVRVGSGEIDNAYIDLLGADLLNSVLGFLNPFAASADKAELRCATAGLIVREGRALIDRSIAVETGNTNVVVDGLVDLGQERLDLAVNTEARGGFTVSAGMLTRLMRLRGTFANPALGLDTGGVARTAASVAAAFATAGVSLVAESVISAVTRDRTPCETALVRAKAAMYGSG